MALIRNIETISISLKTIPVKSGQVIYCTDTKETYMDSTEGQRIQLSDIIKLATETDREMLLCPIVGKIYLVESTNKLYKYNGEIWEAITMDISLEEVSNNVATELVPGTLNKQGVAYAPRTLASLVYMQNGEKVSDVISDLVTEGKKYILQTVTEQDEALTDRQRIYTIPAPLENYDYVKFPIMVLINNKVVEKENYLINGTQLILNEATAAKVIAGDFITFIFHYIEIIVEDTGINAESVNGIRMYVSLNEPLHKKKNDVWFDTNMKQIKQYNGQDWIIIVNGQGGPGGGGIGDLDVLKNSVTITAPTNSLAIGISDYNKETDILFVYKNSVYIEETSDYIITSDSKRIQTPAGVTWEASADIPTTFNFVVLSNNGVIKQIDGANLKDGTVTISKLHPDLQEYLDSLAQGGGNPGPGPEVDLTNYYTKPETMRLIDNKSSDIVGEAPVNLNTLGKIATSLNNDSSYATNTNRRMSNLERRMLELEELLENSCVLLPMSTDTGLLIVTEDGKTICIG